jgi:HPt (histidine-containing phosphotransfer) domain-containing protein
MVTPPIDAATLANLLEATGGDQAFVDELVDTYLAEGDRLVGDVVAAAEAGAMGDLILPAHSLKSSSQNVGALALGELCRRLEEEARSGTIADPADRAEEIRRAFAEAQAALLEERARR